jgi:hypothetical protein
MTGLQLTSAFIKTAMDLGLSNVARVAAYRMLLRFGLHPVQRLRAERSQGPFFRVSTRQERRIRPSPLWKHSAHYFGWFDLPLVDSRPPDWHWNPFSSMRLSGKEWWNIQTFDRDVGDIKAIWELSRFTWALAMAERAAAGDVHEVERLNAWLNDWCRCNPPYRGANWICGQEASIRVLHMASTALILDQHRNPLPVLIALVSTHLRRIASTVSYGVAQDNNHGTSEAAALFIGGSWLRHAGDANGEPFERHGRSLLENRVQRLIETDGTFSQYSVNYHRMLLDTLSIAECWRRQMVLPEFSSHFYRKAAVATHWLFAMVDPANGGAPNVGANDGAHLLQFSGSDYRDYRPSVQLAMTLFAGKRAYSSDGTFNTPLHWLGVRAPEAVTACPNTVQFDDGGFTVMHSGGWRVLLRYPKFRFRPSQADALHVDVWHNGRNILRDGGTYSYSADDSVRENFESCVAHNTIQFDSRDQMPRLGRFLFCHWLHTSAVDPINQSKAALESAAGYRDWKGVTHDRHVRLSPPTLVIIDSVQGFKRSAVLRWRLVPGNWKLSGTTVSGAEFSLSVTASMPVVRCELVEGEESLHYLQRTPLPVLEITVEEAGTLVTEVTHIAR